MAAVKKGDTIKVEYEGSLDDGTVFDASKNHGAPLEFEVGAGQVIKGFEEGVIGLNSGEEKNIKIKPSEAYGNSNPQMIQKVPRDKLPKDQEPKAGMVLMVNLPNGQQMPAKITEVAPDTVTLDLNHPLAGKTLNFKIKVVEIASSI